MSQYLKSIKHITDSLAAAGTPLSSAALVVHTLNGLPVEYLSFVTSIRTRSTPFVIDELHSLLLSEELALLRQNSVKSSFETLPHAFAAVQFGSGSIVVMLSHIIEVEANHSFILQILIFVPILVVIFAQIPVVFLPLLNPVVILAISLVAHHLVVLLVISLWSLQAWAKLSVRFVINGVTVPLIVIKG
ncbi:hypothetical protein GBA52_010480 [Prunus armeniaca]|nr:hypothetical protein GBA52_010480 [Prunus armeniaca]